MTRTPSFTQLVSIALLALLLTGCATASPNPPVKHLERVGGYQVPMTRVLVVYQGSDFSKPILGRDFSQHLRAQVEKRLQSHNVTTESIDFVEKDPESASELRIAARRLKPTQLLSIGLTHATTVQHARSSILEDPKRSLESLTFLGRLQDGVSQESVWSVEFNYEKPPTPELLTEAILKALADDQLLR